jgi:hypothetical protein
MLREEGGNSMRLNSELFGRFLAAILLASLAAVATAQSRPPEMPVRHVAGNDLISPDQPKIRLRVDQAFQALPVLSFPIRRDTWVERYLFVDAAIGKTIRRLIVVQFEHTRVGSAFRFVYPSRPPLQWGDAVYRHGAFVEDDAAEIQDNPGLEVDQTRAYLKAQGYQSGNWWNVARLARVADPEGKTEIILFYQEALTPAQSGSPPASGSDLPESEAKALFERLNTAVKSD